MDNSALPATIAVAALTVEHLQAVGIDLSDVEMEALLVHAQERVDELISEEFFDSLSDEEVDEIIELQQKDSSAEQIDKWLAEHIPDYQQIIEDNTAIVLGELAENAKDIQEA